MREWTDAARAELERRLARIEAGAAAPGADSREVADDLRRHVHEELAASGAGVVTQDEVRRVLARIGCPEPRAAAEEPAARGTPPVPPPAAEPGRASAVRTKLGMILLLLFGVALPLFTLALELLSGMCAGMFFDPVPTIWHVLLVALVPVANAAACAALLAPAFRRWTALGWLSGLAVTVALYYSVLFLPLTPFACVGVLYFGFGLIPLTPLISLIAALRLRSRLKKLRLASGGTLSPRLLHAMPLMLLVVFALSLPKIVTLTGLRMAAGENAAARARGLRLLRAWGSEEVLLRACYNVRKPVTDLVSMIDNLAGGPVPGPEVQEIYYRVTGTPYNAVRPPDVRGLRRGALIDWSEFDYGLGGDAVDAKVRGLALAQSRMDGVVDAAGCTAYVEWTMVFRNASAVQREARAQIALPPGAVVSRLTLWIDGQEREAAFGGRSRVKDAYKRIVQQRRDPVLVTTSGPDQALMQCFPVPPNGGEMKVKVGITAPLFLETLDNGLLRLPFFLEENFGAAAGMMHSVWLEGDGELSAARAGGGLAAERLDGGRYALRGGVASESPAGAPAVRVRRPSPAVESWCDDARVPGGVVRQAARQDRTDPPGRVVVVVDCSRRMAPLAGAVAEAVESCPDGVEIALVAAGDEVIELGGPAPCTAGTRAALAQRAKGIAFRGGCDNVPALLRAWDLAAGRPAGAIVWLHATQPVQMTESEALLQKWERRPGNPTLYDFQFGRGPNKVAEALNGLPAVRRAPCFGDPADDVRRLFGRWSGKRAGFSFERRREQAGETPAEGKGSSHIVRLWAHDEILRLGASRDEGDVKEAVNMALAYRLVTPVSGAVVLETAKQYEDAGLTPAAPGSVPHVVPEPSTWALALLGFAAIRAARRRRHSREAAAGR